tara:strand:+ start:498 stop:965 length:468 start_codon:yes stop_codon:yes gene_type:complete
MFAKVTRKKLALILLLPALMVFIFVFWDNTPSNCDDLVGYIIKLDKDEGKSPYIDEITDIKNYGVQWDSVNPIYRKLIDEYKEESISVEEYNQRRNALGREVGRISCKGNAVLDNGLQGEIYFYDKTALNEMDKMQMLITRNSSTKIGYETSNFK